MEAVDLAGVVTTRDDVAVKIARGHADRERMARDQIGQGPFCRRVGRRNGASDDHQRRAG